MYKVRQFLQVISFCELYLVNIFLLISHGLIFLKLSPSFILDLKKQYNACTSLYSPDTLLIKRLPTQCVIHNVSPVIIFHISGSRGNTFNLFSFALTRPSESSIFEKFYISY